MRAQASKITGENDHRFIDTHRSARRASGSSAAGFSRMARSQPSSVASTSAYFSTRSGSIPPSRTSGSASNAISPDACSSASFAYASTG